MLDGVFDLVFFMKIFFEYKVASNSNQDNRPELCQNSNNSFDNIPTCFYAIKNFGSEILPVRFCIGNHFFFDGFSLVNLQKLTFQAWLDVPNM